MIIAVAAEGKMVSQHFGHCAGFELITVEDGKIKGTEYVGNPGHKPGFLPVFLHDRGANVIIAGGMGASAVSLFEGNGIEVITGVSGMVEKAAEDYIAGNLKSSGSICSEHAYEGSCGGHHQN